ncbi:MAG: glycoside hydrolase family 3 C-terminal domain-containing protein, partial [Firmicutes bacterium]|nr:glycoside hydrolase family 3 C-terminal domain-containing protein [Bacillota bacterium]
MSYPGTTSTAITDREINHALIARRAASEGIVLLENNGILPLEEGAKVALYGGGASFTVKGGTGSGMVNNRTNISITEGMKKAGFTLTTEDWLVAYENAYHATWEAWKNRIYELSGKPGDRMGLYRAHASNPMKMPLGDPITKTDTDTAIYVISRISGEGADRKAVKGDYYLSDDEMDQLKTITTLYPNTIVVLNVGGIIDLSFLETYSISALVLLSQAGMEGGNALADVLSGKVVPSGKLTDSWAYHYEDYPSSRNFSHNNGNIIEEFYTDGIFVGYKYFDSFGILPRYPIGYGRSYSRFDVTAGDLACCDDQVRLKVKVVNRGPFAAKQSVQLFAYLPGGDKAYPLREKELRRMVAFAKTDLLQVGGEQVLELAFPADLLSSYWTARSQVYMDAGLYALELESCDAAGRLVKTPAGLLRVSAFTVLDTLQSICPLVDSLKEIRPDPALIDSLRQSAITAQSALSPLLLDETLEKTILRIRKTHEEDHARALPFAKEVEEILSKMTPRQKSETVCGQPGALSGEIIGSAAITVPGAAGETTHTLAGLGVSHLILADGPAGLRLQKHYQVNPEDG